MMDRKEQPRSFTRMICLLGLLGLIVFISNFYPLKLMLPSSSVTTKTDPIRTALEGRSRRSKAMFCGKQYSPHPINIIQKEFGFQEVGHDAKDWDLIYGFYMHCQPKNPDGSPNHKMDGGLNKRLADEGWSNLKPHQVYQPCMGCHESYCDKVALCHLLRQYNPDLCYTFPEDRERLTNAMATTKDTGQQRLWVLKRDGPDLFLHRGFGVRYIDGFNDTNNIPDDIDDGTYMVQPYEPPMLSYLNRKSEIKVYLAITSIHPLRVYAHKDAPVVLSPSAWKGWNATNKCQHKTLVDAPGCPLDFPKKDQLLTLDEYAPKSGFDEQDFSKKMYEMIAFAISTAHPQIELHPVNKGIRESGASCFSYMRADFGITAAGEPVLYEINEAPYVGGDGRFLGIKNQQQRELFSMIGLDQPPLHPDDREAYETAHSGGWQRIL